MDVMLELDLKWTTTNPEMVTPEDVLVAFVPSPHPLF